MVIRDLPSEALDGGGGCVVVFIVDLFPPRRHASKFNPRFRSTFHDRGLLIFEPRKLNGEPGIPPTMPESSVIASVTAQVHRRRSLNIKPTSHSSDILMLTLPRESSLSACLRARARKTAAWYSRM